MKTRASSLVILVAIAASAAVCGLAPSTALAYPYESYIDIESQEELEDLYASGQISEETYGVLTDLLERGVDINTASRDQLYSLPNLAYDDVDAILRYRKEQGRIASPDDLVAAGVLTQDQLFGIAAFLISVERVPLPLRGWVRGQTRYAQADKRLPPFSLRARVQYRRTITAGVAATMSRLALTNLAYDPNRQGLLADTHELSVHVPKLYVRHENEASALIVGTYRVGFGQRLTFDNSSDYTPNGLYLDDGLYTSTYLTSACRNSPGELPEAICAKDDEAYVTPDYTWSRALRGVAAGIKHLAVGDGYLQAYAWGSYQTNNAYISEIYDRERCDDPRNDDDPNCGSLPVFVRPSGGDRLAPTNGQKFVTLPGVFAETVVGGNVTYFAAPRRYIGVTAYGAKASDLLEGVVLGYQEWAGQPTNGTYGAAGLNLGFGRGAWDLGAEAAYSFDDMKPTSGDAKGGGGPAVVVRGTHSEKHRELEVSLRYFHLDFVNPYARPIAASDEFEGQRARDEVGTRVRYLITTKQYGVRAVADMWQTTVDNTPKASLSLHSDYFVDKFTKVGLWLDWTDKDLSRSGSGECYETEFETDEFGETVACTGQRFLYALRGSFSPQKNLAVSLHGQHAMVDDPRYEDSKRHDLTGTAAMRVKLGRRERLAARVRYLSKDVKDDEYLEESLTGTVEVMQSVKPRQHLKLRLDYVHWLDARASTLERTPNPELRAWLTYQHAI